jgi:hypothetical protein
VQKENTKWKWPKALFLLRWHGVVGPPAGATQGVPGILSEDALLDLQETVRRLKGLLCQTAPDMSSRIRPLLLDLQGVSRDEEQPGITRMLAGSEYCCCGRTFGTVRGTAADAGRLCDTGVRFSSKKRKCDWIFLRRLYENGPISN